jgi:uncharacterized protein YaaQ
MPCRIRTPEIIPEKSGDKALKTGRFDSREVHVTRESNHSNAVESNHRTDEPAVEKLLAVVIQMQDYYKAEQALTEAGFSLSHLSSSGGFLGRRNITLLIGIGMDQEAEAVRILSENCRRRVEYIATPLEGAPFQVPITTPVTVGGATIFTLPVERFEEF